MKRLRKKSALFIGEGSDDAAFLKNIKSIYSSDRKNIKILDGYGGSSVDVVEYLLKNELFDSSGKQFILMDSDRPVDELEKAKVLISKHPSIKTVIFSKKCLEEELLKIICSNDVKKNKTKTSNELKNILESKCKSSKDYGRVFNKEILDKARVGNKWLDSIVKVFE